MNFTITESHTKTIRDSNGDKLFVFSIGTLLDTIHADVWSVIKNYLEYHIVIGCYDKTYDGYRMMNKNDFNGKKFIKYYSKIGHLKTLEKINYSMITIRDYQVVYRNRNDTRHSIYCVNEINPNKMKLYSCEYYLGKNDTIELMEMTQYQNKLCTLGLFILDI